MDKSFGNSASLNHTSNYLTCIDGAIVVFVLNQSEIGISAEIIETKVIKSLGIDSEMDIAILNDSTRYQAEPGNADPEALPRFSRGRASGH